MPHIDDRGTPLPHASGDDVRFAPLAAGIHYYSAMLQALGTVYLLREGKESDVTTGLTSTCHLEFWKINLYGATFSCDA